MPTLGLFGTIESKAEAPERSKKLVELHASIDDAPEALEARQYNVELLTTFIDRSPAREAGSSCGSPAITWMTQEAFCEAFRPALSCSSSSLRCFSVSGSGLSFSAASTACPASCARLTSCLYFPGS